MTRKIKTQKFIGTFSFLVDKGRLETLFTQITGASSILGHR